MARIRTLKPQFWAGVAHMSRDARLFTVALISMADDDGRFIATPAATLGYAYPLDVKVTPAMVAKWMSEVTTPRPGDDLPMVILYSHNGFPYGYFPKYRKHQRISHPQASSLPAPPQEVLFDA